MKKLKADVVVVGAGGAGMCAAVSAAEGGAGVMVFEKNRTAAANQTSFAGGVFAVESKLQRSAGDTLTRDEAFKVFMEHAHWSIDARLVKAFIDKSAGTIEWLGKQGIECMAPGGYGEGGYNTVHGIKSKIRGGVFAEKVLIARAKELGVEIYLGTPVKKIIKSGDRVKAILVEDKSGETIQVDTGAVIIASGGYGYNKEMLKQYGGFDLGRNLIVLHKFKHITGDGIQMAWEIGAAADGMGPHLAGKNIPGPGIELGVPWMVKNQLRVIEEQPYLWVNQEGKRFINEENSLHHPYAANALARQKDKCTYLIFDINTKKYLEEVGTDFEGPMFRGKIIVDLDGQIKQCIAEGNENVYVTNSLSELAGKIGVDPEVLQKTVSEYNRYCEKGHDDLFGKDPKYLRPVKQPKYYAFKMCPIAYGTLGGIKINEKTEVLNKNDEIIYGCYAAGNDACGIYGNPPTYNYKLAGAALGFALNSGCIAGENAAEYIRKNKKG